MSECGLFKSGLSAGTQLTNTLGLVKPYLSHEPRLITLSCRHCVTSFWRAGSHCAREGNSPRELNLSGPTTGPCSILMATFGSLKIFSSGAIRNQLGAGLAAAERIANMMPAIIRIAMTSQREFVASMFEASAM